MSADVLSPDTLERVNSVTVFDNLVDFGKHWADTLQQASIILNKTYRNLVEIGRSSDSAIRLVFGLAYEYSRRAREALLNRIARHQSLEGIDLWQFSNTGPYHPIFNPMQDAMDVDDAWNQQEPDEMSDSDPWKDCLEFDSESEPPFPDSSCRDVSQVWSDMTEDTVPTRPELVPIDYTQYTYVSLSQALEPRTNQDTVEYANTIIDMMCKQIASLSELNTPPMYFIVPLITYRDLFIQVRNYLYHCTQNDLTLP